MYNAIEVQSLCKQYANFKLEDVTFTVPGGSIVGFVGENGAGKTTTIKAIMDVIRPDSGQLKLLEAADVKSRTAVHQDIGIVFDECGFHDWLRAEQVGTILKNVYRNWDAALYQSLLERFGLAGLTKRTDIIKTYSRGMKMKLSLAAALAHHPRLLVLDEATSGLDPVVRDEILDMFLEFIADEEHSILFSSHITSDIEKVADYVIFIHKGRIVFEKEKDQLLQMYGVAHCTQAAFTGLPKEQIVAYRKNNYGIDVLVNNRPALKPAEGLVIDKATIDDIMLFTIRGDIV